MPIKHTDISQNWVIKKLQQICELKSYGIVFSNHYVTKLEINKSKIKAALLNTWLLNNMLLNNP